MTHECKGNKLRRAGVFAALAAIGAAIGAAVWWRGRPSACPYALRIWVQVPHPFITRGRLVQALAADPGQRLLEVGPGTGYYALPIARSLGATGRLDIFDLQQEMLDHTMRRAGKAGIANIFPTQGDAELLPYEDQSFDGAYLVTVLGEIPDQTAALRELLRVLRPGGRLVVGEIFLADPHWVGPKELREQAAATGFEFERVDRYGLGHYAVLRRPAANLAQVAGNGGSA